MKMVVRRSIRSKATAAARCVTSSPSLRQTCCLEVVKAAVKPTARVLNTVEWQGYAKVETKIWIGHATVKHGKADSEQREWARDDNVDGVRVIQEIHLNGCKGSGAALRTYLRGFRRYVTTFEAIT